MSQRIRVQDCLKAMCLVEGISLCCCVLVLVCSHVLYVFNVFNYTFGCIFPCDSEINSN